MANISTEGIEVTRQFKNIFKVLGWGKWQPRNLSRAKISFDNVGKIMTLPGKQTPRQLMARKSSLHAGLRKVFRLKRKNQM